MKRSKIKDVKQGEFFKLKASDSSPVWVRGEYIRKEQKYSCHKYEDSNHEKLFSSNVEVFIGFTC